MEPLRTEDLPALPSRDAIEASCGACDEYRSWTRRALFERTVGRLMPAAGFATQSSTRREEPGRDVLVYLFLQGGLDGLSLCVPHGDPDLYAQRPNLAVPPPGQPGGALDLDGFFGLNPNAAPLLGAYQNGHLAFVHAAGSTDATRSHFVATRRLQFGTPGGTVNLNSGWLARHLAQVAPLPGSNGTRGLGVAEILPKTLAQGPACLPVVDLGAYGFPGDPLTGPGRRAALANMYSATGSPLGVQGLNVFATIDLLNEIDFAGYQPTGGALYPTTQIGRELKQAAALIKAHVGVETINLQMLGWDHHSNLGPVQGKLAVLLVSLTEALQAFYLDLLPLLHRVTVVIQSEFGRQVGENASAGLDHGHGGVMMLLGGNVNGGRVYADWPGLHAAALDDGDLAITTDYRDVLAEVLTRRLGNADLSAVFPGHAPTPLGIVR